LHGLYTCIISVAGWKILVSKYQGSKRNMSIVIGILYVMATISLAFSWSFTRYAFIKNGETFWTVYQALINRSRSLAGDGSSWDDCHELHWYHFRGRYLDLALLCTLGPTLGDGRAS